MAVDLRLSDVKATCEATVEREDMNIVIVGHVDHGKSTIIGRLLADTDSLPVGKLEQVRETCRRNSKPFEYAFLLDALKDEQAQGITIDSARCFFKTAKRNYIIIDAPGHVEFLKNMVTGAARAEAALLVIDATEGIQENSRRHGYMLGMLGIKQVTVLVNKMDLAGYDEAVFRRIVEGYRAFLDTVGIEARAYVPVSGAQGDNIAFPSANMPWYDGPTVLQVLDGFQAAALPVDKPFRMPVQGVYRFGRGNDPRRIVAGTVETGRLRVGDRVVFYPSGKSSRVKSIEAFNAEPPREVTAGYAAGFQLSEQIYVTRGEVATVAGEPAPIVTSRIRASLFWLGKAPMVIGKTYILKLGTARVQARIEKIIRVIDAAALAQQEKEQIDRHDVAECILKLNRPIACDPADVNPQLARFVIVDEYEISGGGIVQADAGAESERSDATGNGRAIPATPVTAEERAARYGQTPALVLVAGERSRSEAIARRLERHLFAAGRSVYYVREAENLQRLAEWSVPLLAAGLVVIGAAWDVDRRALRQLAERLEEARLETVWAGAAPVDWLPDLSIAAEADAGEAAERIVEQLTAKGILFNRW